MTGAITSLREKKDFDLVFSRGKRIDSPLFRFVARRNETSHFRLAVVIAKTVDKRAVIRNTLRRRIKEWLRKQTKKELSGIDLVVMVKKEAVQAPKNSLYEELEEKIKKI